MNKKELFDYAKKHLETGYTKEEIERYLISIGHEPEKVKEIIKEAEEALKELYLKKQSKRKTKIKIKSFLGIIFGIISFALGFVYEIAFLILKIQIPSFLTPLLKILEMGSFLGVFNFIFFPLLLGIFGFLIGFGVEFAYKKLKK